MHGRGLAKGRLTTDVATLPFKELSRIIHADLDRKVGGGLRRKVQGHRETQAHFHLTRNFVKVLQYSSTRSTAPIYYASRTRIRITLEIRVPFELNIELIC